MNYKLDTLQHVMDDLVDKLSSDWSEIADRVLSLVDEEPARVSIVLRTACAVIGGVLAAAEKGADGPMPDFVYDALVRCIKATKEACLKDDEDEQQPGLQTQLQA